MSSRTASPEKFFRIKPADCPVSAEALAEKLGGTADFFECDGAGDVVVVTLNDEVFPFHDRQAGFKGIYQFKAVQSVTVTEGVVVGRASMPKNTY